MLKKIISLVLCVSILCSLFAGMNLSTSANGITYLSSDSAKEFIKTIYGNQKYKPKNTDAYYALLTGAKRGSSDEIEIMHSLLHSTYYCIGQDVYEQRLSNMANRLSADLPLTVKDNLLDVVVSSVADEIIEAISGIGDATDIMEGVKVILATAFAGIFIDDYQQMKYIRMTLSLPWNESGMLLRLGYAADALKPEVKNMLDEWTLCISQMENFLLSIPAPSVPDSDDPNDETDNDVEKEEWKPIPVESVEFYVEDVTIFFNEDSWQTAYTNPRDASYRYLTYYSEDPTIATVSSFGLVTPISPGSTKIYAVAENGKFAYYTLNILPFKANNHTNYYTITEYVGDGGKTTIPSKVNDIPIEEVYAWACDNSKITELHVPSTVRSIGDFAFYNCTDLKKVVFEDGIEEIGKEAFRNTKITTLNLPDTVKTVGDYAFANCESLTQATLSDNLNLIAIGIFANCTKLNSIDIPPEIESIGEYAFYKCKSLETIEIPQTVTDIGGFAFYECVELNNPTIPSGITIFNKHVFYGCKNITEITIPNGVNTIDDCAFEESGLINIEIPNSVKTIQKLAFKNCYNLESVKLPDSITEIPIRAFSDCANLKEISFPKSVKLIGESAFEGCTNLTEINLPDSLESIGARAFYGCEKVGNIIFNEKLIDVGDFAFASCHEIKNILLPKSIKVIGEDIFSDCEKLTNIHYFGTSQDWNQIACSSNNSTLFKLAHSEDMVVKVTCTEPEHCTAESCDYSVGEALGHKYAEKIISPSCVNWGYTEHICTTCGDCYESDTIPPNHSLEETNDGYKYCEKCQITGLNHPDFVNSKYENGYGWADLDNDGLISDRDLRFLNKVVANAQFGEGDLVCKAADVNGDGKIDMKDVVRIKKILGIIPGGGTGAYTTLTDIPVYIK